tara:strand:+ start:865 stop:1161 length:297 start_codon:yes stop_codon:yes gene_type:complete
MAYKSPFERKFGKKHPNNPAERKRKAAAKKTKSQAQAQAKAEQKKSGLSRGEAITKVADAAGKSIAKWQATASEQQDKTMALKDKLRIRRNDRTRERR